MRKQQEKPHLVLMSICTRGGKSILDRDYGESDGKNTSRCLLDAQLQPISLGSQQYVAISILKGSVAPTEGVAASYWNGGRLGSRRSDASRLSCS